MVYLIVNLVLTALITIMLGNMVRRRYFPFGGRYRGFYDLVNLIFVVYNVYAIITTWIALGFTSPIGVIYFFFILIMFLGGWLMDEFRSMPGEARSFGFRFALRSFADRVARALGIKH